MAAAVETVTGLEPPLLDLDPYADEHLADPYPFQALLRETAPVVYLPAHGIYATGRHDEVGTVLSDYRRFITSAGVGLSDIRKPGAWRPQSPILEVDPPVHTGVRAALTRILSPIVIRKWRAAFEAEAEIVAERVCTLGEFDGVEDVAEAFVLTVFPRVLGLEVRRDDIVAIGEMNFNQIGPLNARTQASIERVAPIMPWYQKSIERASLLPGGFGEQIYQAGDAGELDPAIVPGLVRSFVRGGMDTTISGLGFALNLLATHPEQWENVRANPAQSRAAFEEAIRLESPVQSIFRTTAGEADLSGFHLRGDRKIVVFLGAANRDPRAWSAPDRFDLANQALGRHRAFGSGDHICIGQMIARLEAECMLGALARRARTLERTGPVAYRLVNTMRALRHLPLRVVRA